MTPCYNFLMKTNPFSPFFSPKGIVLSGVSQDPNKLGYALARNLYQSGYPGAIHYVNPKGGELFGQTIHPTILDVPDPVDLAVLLVPPPAVPQAMKETGQRGIRAAIVATGGFKETGAEGAKLEEEVLQIAESFGIRFIGPNCVGIINTHYPFDTSFLQPPGPPAGDMAFLSHSGAICAAVIDWIRGQGGGLSHLFSLGNQTSVSEADLLNQIADDPKTRVITLYLEGVKQGDQFIRAASEAVRKKPIVALKVGRFDSGKRAAASHTGALAGQESAFDAAFEKAGVLRANTTEEMFQWARALAWCPIPLGNRVAVLTNSGGPGVTAADALELHGMKLADLSAETTDALSRLLPAAASLHNPVDMLASATPDQFSGSLKLVLDDDGVDSVIVISPPPPPSTTGAVVKSMLPVIQSQHKPVLFVLMGSEQIGEAVSLARAAEIPDYRFPEAAASELGALTRYAEFIHKPAASKPILKNIQTKQAHQLGESFPTDGWLNQEQTVRLLELFGIRTSGLALAENQLEAVRIARKTGYPVVLKLASADISHKSDIGGVLLNLKSDFEVEQAYELIIERARKAHPKARIEGIHVQKMANGGQEVITGFIRDPQFGPLLMFGSGGVEVEGLKDVAFDLAPLSPEDAKKMVLRTWAGKKLRGFRSIAAADFNAVIDVLVRLSQLAISMPQIQELEINPLKVLPPGEGSIAIDIRAKIK